MFGHILSPTAAQYNNLRTKLGGPITPDNLEEFLKNNKLDFQVQKIQEVHPLTGAALPYWGTMRTDTREIFQTGFSDRYRPIQNREAFSVLTEISTKAGVDMRLVKGGAWKGGKEVFAQFDLGAFEVPGAKTGTHDTIARRVTVHTSHDGGGALVFSASPFRPFCGNTLASIQAYCRKGARGNKIEANRISVRHTQKGVEFIGDLPRFVEMMDGEFRQTEALYTRLAATKVDRLTFAGTLDKLFPVEDANDKKAVAKADEQKATVASLYQNADGGKVEVHTAWNLYNAYTRYLDHHAPGIKGGPADRERAILTGSIAEKAEKGLVTVLESFDVEAIIRETEAAIARNPAPAGSLVDWVLDAQ